MPVPQSLTDAIANLTDARTKLRSSVLDLHAANASDANLQAVLKQCESIGNTATMLKRFAQTLEPPPKPVKKPDAPILPGPQVFHAPAPATDAVTTSPPVVTPAP